MVLHPPPDKAHGAPDGGGAQGAHEQLNQGVGVPASVVHDKAGEDGDQEPGDLERSHVPSRLQEGTRSLTGFTYIYIYISKNELTAP